jgi:hypothetical protein
MDIKRRSGAGAIYNSVVVGGTLSTATQALRLVVTDPCGTVTAYPLTPTFTVTTIKDANGMYHYVHTANAQ